MSQKYDQRLEEISLEFIERLPTYQKIISVCHTDADGIASSILIKSLLEFRENFQQFFFDLSVPWAEYLQSLKLPNNISIALIFSDLCCSIPELIDLYTKFPKLNIYILDHHLYDHKKLEDYSDRIFNANPTQFGLHGLKEIVGATVNYLFCKYIDKNISKLAWVAAIGISGDTLQHIDQMRSYNRAIIDEAHEHGQIEIKAGLCLFGGQFDRIDRALALSIIPFIPEVNGSRETAKILLQQLSIDPKIKVEDLTEEMILAISEKFNIPSIRGEFLILPKKKGILRYGFEHAQVLAIIGHDHPFKAIQLLGTPNITQDAKDLYIHYTQKIVNNLSTFVKINKIETNHAIFVDLTNEIPKNEWSDTGSLASINEIYDVNKVLFIGGIIDTNLKLSLRCTPHFIDLHHGQGVNIIIEKLSQLIGAKGGGHGLAGGLRLDDASKMTLLIQKIDQIIEDL